MSSPNAYFHTSQLIVTLIGNHPKIGGSIRCTDIEVVTVFPVNEKTPSDNVQAIITKPNNTTASSPPSTPVAT